MSIIKMAGKLERFLSGESKMNVSGGEKVKEQVWALTGYTPTEYIRRLRLSRSAMALKKEGGCIIDIKI